MRLAFFLTLWLASGSLMAQTRPLESAQAVNAPQEAHLWVEIPAESAIKYETDKHSGQIFVDRFLAMPMHYPANYGSMPRTLAGDGDPLDALVLTRSPLHPGVIIRFRPVAVLRMQDGGEADEKIIGVPVERVDAHYAGIRDLADLNPQDIARIEAFFRHYKAHQAGGNPVTLHGWGNAAEARQLIEQSMRRAAQ